MNEAYEERNAIAKEISKIHLAIADKYKMMGKRNEEYYWSILERDIAQLKEDAAVLRLKLKDATNRFVNWQTDKK